jgi:hypothetical protein
MYDEGEEFGSVVRLVSGLEGMLGGVDMGPPVAGLDLLVSAYVAVVVASVLGLELMPAKLELVTVSTNSGSRPS